MEQTTPPTALQQLQDCVDAIRAGNARLGQVRAELDAANAPYDRIISALHATAAKMEQLRDADPRAREMAIAATNLSCDLAWQETRAEELAMTAWRWGEFGDKKTVTLAGATVQVRETTRREITAPIAFLDTVRATGLYDKLVKGIKVSVNTAAFNRWVDLMDPDCVASEVETAAYVRLE